MAKGIYLKKTETRRMKMDRIGEIIGDTSDTAIIDFALNSTLSRLEKRNPALCLGYIQVQRPGDTAECIECGAPNAEWVAVMETGAYGPLCSFCADSE